MFVVIITFITPHSRHPKDFVSRKKILYYAMHASIIYALIILCIFKYDRYEISISYSQPLRSKRVFFCDMRFI